MSCRKNCQLIDHACHPLIAITPPDINTINSACNLLHSPLFNMKMGRWEVQNLLYQKSFLSVGAGHSLMVAIMNSVGAVLVVAKSGFIALGRLHTGCYSFCP